jgi:hypothetical protein
MELINKYEGKGEDAWGVLFPCSTFAADAWNKSTGEDLSPYGPYSNPSSLKNSILDANNAYQEGWHPAPVEYSFK